MNNRISITVALLLAFCLSAFAGPRNIILLIGDGMSVPQRMAADEFARKCGLPPLVMNRLGNHSMALTYSANSPITDSSAAATAIACGEKTLNGALGVDVNGRPLESCASVAHRFGKKVGIMTTVTINHATPGGFFAHRKNRHDEYGCGLDLVNSGFDYFAGGGVAGHGDAKHAEYRGDIYDLAAKSGYRVIRGDRAAFDALRPGCGKVLFAACEDVMPYSIDEDAWVGVPNLAEMTKKGIELLENEKGFFMMVEGGHIDHACHANDAAATVMDVIAFDDAVKVAVEFQKRIPDTLIVVTGDHETGGMALGCDAAGNRFQPEFLAHQKCCGNAISVFFKAAHPRVMDDVKPFLIEKFGFDFSSFDTKANRMAMDAAERSALADALVYDINLAKAGKKDDERYDAKKITRFPAVVKQIMSRKCGIGWTSGRHSAMPALTTAAGPGAERFSGCFENVDFAITFKKMLSER